MKKPILKLKLLAMGLLLSYSLSAQNCINCSVIRSGYKGIALQLNSGECAELLYGKSVSDCVAQSSKPKDSDGDGIIDTEDACPNVAGVLSAKGCKDADGDGIKDEEDACLSTSGIAAFKGCPDTDKDGVQDSEDKCPTIAGLISLKGCADTDGDGIADNEDKCPTVAGTLAFNGCKDSDGDGIADNEDKCPTIAGTLALNGCKDSDSDGVADNEDKCPEIKGLAKNKGCPEVDKKTIDLLKKALKGVQFQTGKDIIKPESFGILDNVVSALKAHSEYKLRISGHTDNVGDREKNIILSSKRAEAAKNYLISKGIAAESLISEGFGPDKPVADNNTPAGKSLNRRVEFVIEF